MSARMRLWSYSYLHWKLPEETTWVVIQPKISTGELWKRLRPGCHGAWGGQWQWPERWAWLSTVVRTSVAPGFLQRQGRALKDQCFHQVRGDGPKDTFCNPPTGPTVQTLTSSSVPQMEQHTSMFSHLQALTHVPPTWEILSPFLFILGFSWDVNLPQTSPTPFLFRKLCQAPLPLWVLHTHSSHPYRTLFSGGQFTCLSLPSTPILTAPLAGVFLPTKFPKGSTQHPAGAGQMNLFNQ